MFKKLTAFFTAAVICLTMAACTGNSDGDTTGDTLSSSGSENEYIPFDSEKETPDGYADSAEGSGNGADSADTQPTANTVTVTLTEGMTMVKMSWVLEEKGVCSSDAFIQAAQNTDFSKYPLVAAAMKEPNVCFPLEGYLKPDTYEFYKDEDPNLVLDKLLSATESAITSQMRSRASALGYSMHEILTVASIIEKEAQSEDQRSKIASIIYNRLETGMKLQCDVTINYVEYVIYEVYPDNDTYKYYYNTYRCAALPAGPICNPGMASITAALYPDDTDYLYFAVKDGKALYAADFNTHLANCDELGVEY